MEMGVSQYQFAQLAPVIGDHLVFMPDGESLFVRFNPNDPADVAIEDFLLIVVRAELGHF
jgi:hypothetical protein